MKIDAVVIGGTDCVKRIREYAADNRKKTREAMKEIGADKLVLSQALVPVKTGDLKGSGFFNVRVGEKQITLRIGYKKPYAFRVHDDLQAKHKNGKAKFLSDVTNAMRLDEELAEKIGA